MDFYHSPSETCVVLTAADQFVGRDDGRLEQRGRIATFVKEIAHFLSDFKVKR